MRDADDTARLSRAGRQARAVALTVGLALLLAGSLRGSDDDFPFGPFRMYATADDPDGRVVDTYLRAVDADGAVVARVGEGDIGLRRAEYEGQLDRLVRQPELLGDIARTFARRHPGRPPWVEVAVLQTAHPLDDGRPGAPVTTTLRVWRAP